MKGYCAFHKHVLEPALPEIKLNNYAFMSILEFKLSDEKLSQTMAFSEIKYSISKIVLVSLPSQAIH